MPSPPAAAIPLSETSLARSREILQALTERSGPDDPRYYADRVWHDGTDGCFRCSVGPAVLASVYAVRAHDSSYRDIAIESMDQAIATHQAVDGSFGPPGKGEDGPVIQTVLFTNALASTYLILGSELDAEHQTRWAAAITEAADYLIGQGAPEFYVNGNINLSVSMNLDLAYRITRLDRFRAAAARAIAFTLSPPQDRWPGFGLIYAKEPQRADGSDGAGYLAESGGSEPGFDPAYTLYQTDIAALWFVLTGDETAKRLSNLLYNHLSPRARTSDWTVDVGGGTRRAAEGVRYGFLVSALPALALRGGRTDLGGLVTSQVEAALAEGASTATSADPGVSNNYGARLAPSLYVVTSAPGW